MLKAIHTDNVNKVEGMLIYNFPVLGPWKKGYRYSLMGSNYSTEASNANGSAMLETALVTAPFIRFGAANTGAGVYIPKTPLAQQKVAGWDIPLPDARAGSFPHTTLGGKMCSDAVLYGQSATFTGGSWPKANGQIVPWSRVDWSSHGRPLIHANPHQHIFNWNGTNWHYGSAIPF